MSKEKKSEFGRGLTYCIGLFLAHVGRLQERKEIISGDSWAEMWFNGASDHLYGLDTTRIDDERFRKEIDDWAKKVLHWGHSFTEPHSTEQDVRWSIERAKYFLRQVDKEILGVKTIKGQWE